jgi:NADH-ubiquinone oxidoreductase chain 2
MLVNCSRIIFWGCILCLFSLGGLPPFLGFLPKWVVVEQINSPFLLFGLIIGSLMNLSYYLVVMINLFIGIYRRIVEVEVRRFKTIRVIVCMRIGLLGVLPLLFSMISEFMFNIKVLVVVI